MRHVQCFKCLEKGHYSSDYTFKRIMVLNDQDIESKDHSYSSSGEEEVLDPEVGEVLPCE